jgi:hypothetical protein
MSQAQTFYERHWGLVWWFVTDRIGRGLRERYEIPKELPRDLRLLIVKLAAAEGNYLLRYSGPHGSPIAADDDWLFPTVSWQDDLDLIGGRLRGQRQNLRNN